MKYRISIHQDGPGRYRTQGSSVLAGVHSPLRAAALDLIANGADQDSKIAAEWHGCSIVPVSIAKLVRAYTPPRVRHRESDPSLNVD